MKQYSLLLICLFTLSINAQNFTITGTVSDSLTGQPLASANVQLINTNFGTTSDLQGNYILEQIPKGEYRIKVSYVGYKSKVTPCKLESNLKMNFDLHPTPTLLDDTIVESTLLDSKNSAVNFSEIHSPQLKKQVAMLDAVSILNQVPNMYASPQGGGTGDIRLNMRGFDQTNIGVMINGVVLNNPENGEVYWSNYAGIADVVDNIQIQRGVGAVPYSTSAVGGLVNIVTTGFTNTSAIAKLISEVGSDNFRKTTMAFSTPLQNNFSLTALVSKKTMDGFVDQTQLDEFTYYLSFGAIVKRQSFIFQIIGSPQRHGQRISPSLISEYKNFGYNYNPDWGYLHGEPLMARDNKFHKPSLNLIHTLEINSSLTLSNLLYYTHGSGGGTVPPYTEFGKTPDGQIDFQKEWNLNSNNVDSTFHSSLTRTLNPLRDVVHKHNWFGGVSSLLHKADLSEYRLGFDWKYYSAQNYATIGNLLGGDYYIDFANKNRAPNTRLKTGDKIDYNADSFARHFGAFFQTKLSFNAFNLISSLSASNTSYKRRDHFNYSPSDSQFETDWESFNNYSLKLGISYLLNEQNKAFINFSYFTKAPISFNVFDYSNNKYKNAVNEKVLTAEIAYTLQTESILFSTNIYLTNWKDKAISRTVQDTETGQFFFYNILGAAATHSGIETELQYHLSNRLMFGGMFSYAVNKWTNNVNAILAPESDPTQKTEFNSYTDNLFVGNSPMTRAYLSLEFNHNFSETVRMIFNPTYSFFGRMYSEYDPALRTDPNEAGINSWETPDYYLLSLNTSFEILLNKELLKKLSIVFNIFNLLDSDNIVYALDGIEHNSETAKVFFGRPRSWHLSFILEM